MNRGRRACYWRVYPAWVPIPGLCLGITVQVVPVEVGTHAGLLGAFIVAGSDGAPSILYAETAVAGQTIEKPALVSKAALAFDRLRAEALPRGASRDLIGKVAEERWTA
jgi:hypothetical protein